MWTTALTDDGQLYVWGRGNEGQLGLGDYRPRSVPALVNLGYPRAQAEKLIAQAEAEGAPEGTTEELIRAALKAMAR